MEPKLDADSLHFNTDRRRRSSCARAIPYASYSETMIALAPVLIGPAVLAGVTVSILIALTIF